MANPPPSRLLTVADLGLTFAKMRSAVSVASVKEAHVRRVIRYNDRHWGVFGWVRISSRHEVFVLFQLHPERAHPFLFAPETWGERLGRGGDVDDLNGMLVADVLGNRWVIDQGERLVVVWREA